MTLKTLFLLGASLSASNLVAQPILFDFDNAPLQSPLPISLTVGGLTAQFSATGDGFSVQRADVLGFTPAGFSGLCLDPRSVFAADLLISFSQNLKDFSILYAPEEYACDSSATMRVTAYLDATQVGTAITNAQAGTWPTETLAISPGKAFNRVVVHYDKAPVTGGDYGPVFMADNMVVTPEPPPLFLQQPEMLTDGSFRFSFNQAAGQSFAVFGTTNTTLPVAQWTQLGTAIEIAAGQYQFTDSSTGGKGRYYCISSP